MTDNTDRTKSTSETGKRASPSSSESLTARTQGWEARTARGGEAPSLTGSPQTWPTQSALAAQSLRKARRIKDTDERRVAFAAHMERFPPLIGRL